MATTSTKFLLFTSWFLSLFGKSLTGISWKCPTQEMVSSDFGCYLFHAGQLTFDDSEAYCWNIGSTLLWVEGQDEMVYLAGQALQSPQVTAWMIGLHSKSVRKDLDSYTWSSGHKVSFTAWSDIEPDHYENERCVTMELKYGYRWATKSCETPRSFICKSDPPFFRLKNPILLGVLGVVSILLIILIFVLCTMKNRSKSDDHHYCSHRPSCNQDGRPLDTFTLNRIPSQPSAPPVDARYTSLPSASAGSPGVVPPPVLYHHQPNGNEPIDHIYEDVDGHRRLRAQPPPPVQPDAASQQTPQPTNPYLMWA